jgi:CheY-like chemotaxis protein
MNSPPHIVLVDDDGTSGLSLRQALAANGYTVTATSSAETAFTLIHGQHPDLLILALNTPGADGFEFLRIKRSKYPYLRTLVISGYLSEAVLEAAELLGAVATLEKPVAAEALVEKVRAIVGR